MTHLTFHEKVAFTVRGVSVPDSQEPQTAERVAFFPHPDRHANSSYAPGGTRQATRKRGHLYAHVKNLGSIKNSSIVITKDAHREGKHEN